MFKSLITATLIFSTASPASALMQSAMSHNMKYLLVNAFNYTESIKQLGRDYKTDPGVNTYVKLIEYYHLKMTHTCENDTTANGIQCLDATIEFFSKAKTIDQSLKANEGLKSIPVYQILSIDDL
jgi:ERCC4-type nuclease